MDVRLTRQTWKILNEVNLKANNAIEPISNFDHWGTTLDHWDYPVDGKGDCKIYALFKRKLLIDRGFPRQALLMTIVRDLNGEGHAVLTVKTDRGDFVLDNLSDEIRPWSATGYQFYRREAHAANCCWPRQPTADLRAGRWSELGAAARAGHPAGDDWSALDFCGTRPVPRASRRSRTRSPSGWRPDALDPKQTNDAILQKVRLA